MVSGLHTLHSFPRLGMIFLLHGFLVWGLHASTYKIVGSQHRTWESGVLLPSHPPPDSFLTRPRPKDHSTVVLVGHIAPPVHTFSICIWRSVMILSSVSYVAWVGTPFGGGGGQGCYAITVNTYIIQLFTYALACNTLPAHLPTILFSAPGHALSFSQVDQGRRTQVPGAIHSFLSCGQV